MDGVIEEASDIAGQAIAEVSRDGSNWAAIILLMIVLGAIAIAGLAVYFLMRGRVSRAAQRAEDEKQRTNDEKASADERLLNMQIQHQREMQFREDMNSRYDETLNKVNTTLGGVAESWRQSNLIHEGTRQALQRNSDLLERFAPAPLPKRNLARKPQAPE